LACFAADAWRVAVTSDGHRFIIFGFSPQNLKTKAVAVAFSMATAWAEAQAGRGREDQAWGRLASIFPGTEEVTG
jgi:hypothetical protein